MRTHFQETISFRSTLTSKWVKLFRLSNDLGLDDGGVSLSTLLLLLSSGKSGGEGIIGLFRSGKTFSGSSLDLSVELADGVDSESLKTSIGDEKGELTNGKTGLGDVERRVRTQQSSSSVE